MKAKSIIVLILLTLVVIFLLQNITVVKIQFLFWSIQMSRALFMFFILAIGIFVGWALGGYYRK